MFYKMWNLCTRSMFLSEDSKLVHPTLMSVELLAYVTDHSEIIDSSVMQRTWPLSGPLDWIRYINKHVKVKARTGEEREHRGWLLTVDPVSASLVLVNFEVGGASVRVVMGHVVEEVEVLQEADQETVDRLQAILFQTQSSDLDPEQLQLRKDTVRQWLQKNLIPVEEEGAELKVAGVLTISAPYRPEDCRSCNQIILDRIQRLIRIKPED